jgi:hypothetical protein
MIRAHQDHSALLVGWTRRKLQGLESGEWRKALRLPQGPGGRLAVGQPDLVSQGHSNVPTPLPAPSALRSASQILSVRRVPLLCRNQSTKVVVRCEKSGLSSVILASVGRNGRLKATGGQYSSAKRMCEKCCAVWLETIRCERALHWSFGSTTQRCSSLSAPLSFLQWPHHDHIHCLTGLI